MTSRSIATKNEDPASGFVSLWRHRYADHGLEGLQDNPRPGKQPIYTKATDKRILRQLDKPPQNPLVGRLRLHRLLARPRLVLQPLEAIVGVAMPPKADKNAGWTPTSLAIDREVE